MMVQTSCRRGVLPARVGLSACLVGGRPPLGLTLGMGVSGFADTGRAEEH